MNKDRSESVTGVVPAAQEKKLSDKKAKKSFLITGWGAIFSLFLFASCSTSRLNDGDQILPPGAHVIRSVIDSDILIPNGSTLRCDYMAGNRIFVQSGGTLTGLSKGAQRSTIYVEPGAQVPARSGTRSFQIRQVEDAEEAYNTRFRSLLPAGADQGSGFAPGYVAGGGFFGGGLWGFHRPHRHFRSRSRASNSRSVSVRPDSYRARN